MKTTSTILAVLLLASPLLATMGTYTTKDVTLGSTTAKLGWAKDTDTRTKFYVEIPTAAPTADTQYCIYIGIPGASASATDWKSTDLGLFGIKYTAAVAGPPAVAASWSISAPTDNFCKSTATASGDAVCTLNSAAESDNDWAWVSTASTDADKLTYSTTKLVLEASRTTAATTAATDVAITATTTSVYLGYLTTTNAAACPSAADATITIPSAQRAAVTGLTSPLSTSSGSGSFGALTYLSWVALLISYALLN